MQPAQQLRQRGLARTVLADDRERAAGGNGEVEALEDRPRLPGIGEVHADEADLADASFAAVGRAQGSRGGGRRRRGERAHARHRRPQARRGHHGGGCTVECPGQAAERDHAGRDGGAGEGNEFTEGQGARQRILRQRHEQHEVRAEHQHEAGGERALAQPRGRPAQVVQPPAVGDEARDGPVREPEHAQLLGRGCVHGEPVAIVRVPLRLTHLVGVAVLPHRALAQQPVGGKPRAPEQQRRPPRIGGEQQRGHQAGEEFHEPAGNEVHRDGQRRAADAEVEVARHREVAGERIVLEVRHARWLCAAGHQLVVQPRGHAAAEVLADGLVQWREHLQQHEQGAGDGERCGQGCQGRRAGGCYAWCLCGHVRTGCLDGADEHAHGDGKPGRQQPARDEDGPPQRCQRPVCTRQRTEECPLVACAQRAEHWRVSCHDGPPRSGPREQAAERPSGSSCDAALRESAARVPRRCGSRCSGAPRRRPPARTHDRRAPSARPSRRRAGGHRSSRVRAASRSRHRGTRR